MKSLITLLDAVADYLRKQGPLFSLTLDMIGKPDNMYRESHNFLLPANHTNKLEMSPISRL